MAQSVGKKLDPALKARLLSQRKAMSTGLIIKNVQFTKGIFHILPAKQGETPGVEYLSLFCRKLNKGTTCARVFGLNCPLMDWKDKIAQSGSKEERDIAYKALGVETEYWTPLIPKDDLGTVAVPNIKILRVKKKLYEQITARMVDDDIGEDITDLIEGRPVLIKKTGEKKDTRWSADFLDREPISDDPEYIEAVRAAVEAFDVRTRFFRVDWDKVAEIYACLTGEEMDSSYREQEGADAGASADGDDDHGGTEVAPAATTAAPAKPAPRAAPAKPAATAPAKPAPAPAKPAAAAAAGPQRRPAPAPAALPEPEPDENGVIVGETVVSFNDADGNEVVGTVMKSSESGYDVVVPEGDHGAGEWTVNPGEFTLVEPEGEEAQGEVAEQGADEPSGEEAPPAEEAPPVEVKRAPARAPAKPAAAAPAKAAPAKAAAAAAPAKAPVVAKPGLASSSLRARVKR